MEYVSLEYPAKTQPEESVAASVHLDTPEMEREKDAVVSVVPTVLATAELAVRNTEVASDVVLAQLV